MNIKDSLYNIIKNKTTHLNNLYNVDIKITEYKSDYIITMNVYIKSINKIIYLIYDIIDEYNNLNKYHKIYKSFNPTDYTIRYVNVDNILYYNSFILKLIDYKDVYLNIIPYDINYIILEKLSSIKRIFSGIGREVFEDNQPFIVLDYINYLCIENINDKILWLKLFSNKYKKIYNELIDILIYCDVYVIIKLLSEIEYMMTLSDFRIKGESFFLQTFNSYIKNYISPYMRFSSYIEDIQYMIVDNIFEIKFFKKEFPKLFGILIYNEEISAFYTNKNTIILMPFLTGYYINYIRELLEYSQLNSILIHKIIYFIKTGIIILDENDKYNDYYINKLLYQSQSSELLSYILLKTEQFDIIKENITPLFYVIVESLKNNPRVYNNIINKLKNKNLLDLYSNIKLLIK